MLEEKCDEMHQSKLFYKEQWSKANREVSQIRREKIICAKEEILDDKCERLVENFEVAGFPDKIFVF